MSARCCARALWARGSRRANVRRGFATTPRRPGADPAASRPVGSNQTSGWSGLRVLAVAGGAGAVGWGLASVSGQGDARGLFGANSAPRYATLPEMEEAIRKIEKEIGIEDIISTDADDLHAHGYSEWSSVNLDTLPVAVAYPRNTEQVSVIARVCHEYRIPIIPYSGGSSLEGNFSAPYGGVSVDFAYMNQIMEFNKEDMDIVVQPSIGWQDLNEKLAKMDSGLFFPIDPGPSAKIGGMIGTNCSGTNAVRYGTMKDWVINLTVVLADGRIIKTRRRPRKSSAGYNLNSLFVGSEGTLGLVTEATLKLAVVPEQYSVAVVTFPSIRDAAAAAAGVMQTGVPIAAMEIMDEVQMKVVNLGGATFPRVWKEVPTLFFKFSGTKEGVREAVTRVQKITAANKGGNFEFARDEREQKLLWSARKESLWSMLSLRKEGEETWSTDVAVPFSRLADIIEVSKKEMDDLGLFASILGHIGDGNFHESIMYNREIPGEREKVEKCIKNMVKRALDMEGTCTGEHGIGWGKKESLLWEVGPETLAVMGSLKGSLDPRWQPPNLLLELTMTSSPSSRQPPFEPAPLSFGSPRRRPHGDRANQASPQRGENLRPAINQLPSQASGDFTAQPPIEWQMWPELTVGLEGLPPNTTTTNLWDWFSREGDIVYMEIFANGNARIKFEPPPKRPFWEGGSYRVIHPDVTRYPKGCSVSVAPWRSIPTRWIQSPISAARQYPVKMTLQPLAMQFGSRTGPDTMKIMKSISAPAGDDSLKIELNLKIKILTAFFRMEVETRNGRVLRQYKFVIQFTRMKHFHKTVSEDGSISLVLPLKFAPRYYWKEENSRSTIGDENKTWGESESWYRATDILKYTGRPMQHPVALHTEYDDPGFIDIGRWTTLTSALEDFNIVSPVSDNFKATPGQAPELWGHLEHPRVVEEGNALYLLELSTNSVTQLPFEVRYQLEACISRGVLNEHCISVEFLNKLASLNSTKARLLLEYLADRDEFVEDPTGVFDNLEANAYFPSVRVPHYCALMRKVVVTPTTIRFSTPTVETSNRVLRRYNNIQDRFLRVQFVDEYEHGRITSPRDQNDEIWKRLLRTLYQGIRIGDRKYEQCGVYFFCPTGHISCDDIRKWMGQFDHIKIIAKEVRGISVPSIRPIQDIERNGYCFTDGVGKISPFIAQMIIEDFQVHVRESQQKFKAEFNGLEIIRCAKFATATLNRQTITILESLGLPINLLKKFVDENQTTLAIAEMLEADFKTDETQEPFVLLKEKARIHVEKSAFVLGCVDETCTLRGHSRATEGSGITDSKDYNRTRIIKGVCLIGRNPSLHPGDIRVVEAADEPKLHHLRDVVVFPAIGDRPVPNMLSGGDLDGDDFFVMWEPLLMPRIWNYPPMDYAGSTPQELDRDVNVDDLRNFFVKYMKNDVLPMIAHAHLANADRSRTGPMSPQCLELAHLHSKAVDYPKTGEPATLRRDLQPRQWPHFMDKKNSYRSGKALGVIYDNVVNKSIQFNPIWDSPFDKRIIEHKTYAPDSDMLNAARQIKSHQHDLDTEFELYTGFAMSKAGIGSDYKRQEELGREYDMLKHKFRDMCYEAAGGKHAGMIDRFVVAMYTVTEEETKTALSERHQGPANDTRGYGQSKLELKAMPLISFPWIFHWVLIRLAGRDSSSGQDAGGRRRPQPSQPLDARQAHSANASLKSGTVETVRTDLEVEDHVNLPDGTVIQRGQPLTLFDTPEVTSSESLDSDQNEGDTRERHGGEQALDSHDIEVSGEVEDGAKETGDNAAQGESAMDRLARLIDGGEE
ncbi:RNA dependent RNA polymerase-domain-containing protein [Dactylonectria estremocensis]|uniref:D-lactate dehydrogenase (cytochrome) n=1 Tax=Dactylonectria estremocensis TaxID=1079267 RepID=A0A9P9FCC6_9HYPO|nr:RNA dependent RNA polymerase-domain-containing protein [Dactylonectria estremocensis]